MTANTSAPSAEAYFTARQWWVIILLCGAQFMLALDFSILSVSLPVVGNDLKLSLDSLQWLVTAFALPSGGFLLLFGRTADLYGRRKLFLIGMAVFTVASLAGGLAVSPTMLFAARAAQGFGAAMLTPSAMSLLTTSFEEGPRRNRAIGINGTLLSLGFLSGVVLGGIITQTLGWRFTLLINLPLGLAALIAAPLLIKESRQERTPRLDVPGALTVTGGLLGIIFGVTSADRVGWGSAETLIPLVAGVLLLGAFLAIESRRHDPLVRLDVLKRRAVGLGNLTGLITFSMVTGVVFLLTLYMQRVRGLSPLNTGFCFASLGIAAVIGGAFAAKIVGRLGVQKTLVTGLVLQAVGSASLLMLGSDDGIPLLLVAAAVIGFGHLLAVVGYMITVTTGVPNDEQGMATGLAYTAQQVGLSVGTPVVSSIAAGRVFSLNGTSSLKDATLSGVQLGIFVDCLVVVAAVAIAVIGLRSRSARTPLAPVAQDEIAATAS